jgi:hypothetical protein
VLVHAELLLLFGVGAYLFLPRDADLARAFAGRGAGADSIEVGMLDEAAAREIIAELERQDEERKAEEAKKEENSLKAPGQVVDLPTPREEKRPTTRASSPNTTARSSARPRSTAASRTTRAREPTRARRRCRVRPSLRAMDGWRCARPISAASCAAPGRRDRRRAPGNRATRTARPTRVHLEQGGVIPELGADAQPRPGGGGAKGGSGPSLMPSEEQLARAIGGGTQDALRDIDDGDETALNSKRWRFASFFNRVKRQVAEHWHPDEVYRQRDPTGSVYGRRNRYTELRIQLKPDGRLSNVALAQPSGSSSSTTRRSRRSRRRSRSRTRRASSSRTAPSTSASASCSI